MFQDLRQALLASFGAPSEITGILSRRNAAVAVVLRPALDGKVGGRTGGLGGVDMLFIRRSKSERDPWSGHMALPGGRFDKSDASLIHTASRETQEETGLDLEAGGQLLGRMDELRPVGPNLPAVTIQPFVYSVRAKTEAWVNSHEVGEVHWLSLTDLKAPELQGEVPFCHRGEERTYPCIRINDRVIWGLTYRIVERFMSLAAQ